MGCKENVICEIWIDKSPQVTCALVYKPDIERINRQIHQWQKSGIRFCGLFHSHIAEEEALSSDDIAYIHRIVQTIPQDYGQLLFPVVVPGKKVTMFYAAEQDNALFIGTEEIEIVDLKPEGGEL